MLGPHGTLVGVGVEGGGVDTFASSVEAGGEEVKIGDVVCIDGLMSAPGLNGLVEECMASMLRLVGT